jgi:hypothetical protein
MLKIKKSPSGDLGAEKKEKINIRRKENKCHFREIGTGVKLHKIKNTKNE